MGTSVWHCLAQGAGDNDAQAILPALSQVPPRGGEGDATAAQRGQAAVVGNEAVGKTSLIRYLVNNEPREPDEKETPGTAIHERSRVSPGRWEATP